MNRKTHESRSNRRSVSIHDSHRSHNDHGPDKTHATTSKRPAWSALPLLLALAALALIGGVLLPGRGGLSSAAAHGGVDVELVVDFGDGRVEVSHLDAISGTTALDALLAIGLDVVTHDAGFGEAVCAVGGVGCPAENCFCACPGEDCRFWGVQAGDGAGGWAALEVGAGDYVLPAEGSVLGFVWGRSEPIGWTPERLSALSAWRWLRGQLQPDGGLFDAGLTVDGVLAARGVHAEVGAWRGASDGPDVLTYLRANGADYAATGAAQAGKRLAGLAATDEARGSELEAARQAVLAYQDLASGRFDGSTWGQGWALLGLSVSGEVVQGGSLAVLEDGAAVGGGWGDLLGAESASVDATGLAMAALGAAGAPASTAVGVARTWLAGARQADGGWGTGPEGPSNVNSTAMALYGLLAVGEDPAVAPWTVDGVGPLEYLRGTQDPAGFFLHAPEANELLATLQALPALAGRVPVTRGASVAIERAVAAVLARRQPDGGFETGLVEQGPAATIDAILALVAAGVDPRDGLAAGAPTVVDWLAAEGPAYAASGPEGAGRIVAALVALGEDPSGGGAVGFDALAALKAQLDPESGRFGESPTPADQAWGIMGMAAAGQALPETAVPALLSLAGEQGWGIVPQAALADADHTALALEALRAAGQPPEAETVRRAVMQLGAFQGAGGAFVGAFDQPGADTTGLAIRALAAAGQHVDGPGWARAGEGLIWTTPREALVAMQRGDGLFPGLLGDADPSAAYRALHGLAARADYVAPTRSGGRVWLPLLVRGK